MKQRSQAQTNETGVPRSILSLRISALVETLAFLAVALVIDAYLGAGDRFSQISPHPFWIIVLLVSTYYGTNEGLAAATMCAVAALAGHIPEQGFNEERTAWLLRVSADPVFWIMAALILGEIRSGHRQRYEKLKGELESAHQRVTAITTAYEMLSEAKSTLEVRVAAQSQTVHSVYRAFRIIDRQEMNEVLAGVPDLVRTIMMPKKFSVFLLKGSKLVATASEGWHPADEFRREFEASRPLFQAVVAQRQRLLVSDPTHEAILAGEGILAGPLLNPETGAVFGMLKIEQIGLTGLSPSALLEFGIMCEWIGTAHANAQQIKARKSGYASAPMQQLLPGTTYDIQRAGLTNLACEACFNACAFYASFEPDPESARPDEALIAKSVLRAAGEILTPNNLRFKFGTTGSTYAVLLPSFDPQMADDIAQRFSRLVCGILAEEGFSVRSRHLVEILHRRESSMRSEVLDGAHQQA